MTALISIAEWLERVTNRIGRLAAWASLLLMGVIIADVVLRRYFVIGSVKLQELEWHLHGALFLLTLAYAYNRDRQVRIELIRQRLSDRAKAWIELIGIILLLLPFTIAVILFGTDYALISWRADEISASQTGLGARWIIKAAMPLGFVLLALSGLSRLLRNLAILMR